MIDDDSNKASINHCKNCGNKINQDQIDKIFEGQDRVVCELCGAKLKKKHFKSEEKKLNGELLYEKLARQMRIFTFRCIYEILYTPEFIEKIKKGQKELTQEQAECLAKNIRKSLLNERIPDAWLENALVSRKDFTEYYNEFIIIVSDKNYKAEYLESFQEWAQDVFEFISGKKKISSFQEKNQIEIIESLKKNYGFPSNYNKQGTFEYYFTLLAARYFYIKIKKSKITALPNKKYIEKLAGKLITEISNDTVKRRKLEQLPKKIRQRFKTKFENLLQELSWNQIYRESFIDYFIGLTKIILELINAKNNLSDLQGIKFDVAENLIRMDLFKEDDRFTVDFKGNLVIALSRIIYIKIKTLTELADTVNREIADYLMTEILTKESIDRGYLNNLNQIQLTDFDNIYQKFRLELISDKVYAESFRNYLRWLIGIVYELISGEYDKQNLSDFSRTLISNLKNFNENGVNLNTDGYKSQEVYINRPNNADKSLNQNKKKERIAKMPPVVQAFVRKDYKQALREILNHITSRNLNISDFDNENIITQILESIIGPISNAYQKLSDVKKEIRIRNKKAFISRYGKVMLEILDFKKNTQQIDIKNLYGVGDDPIKSMIRFLSYNHETFLPEARFKQINIFKESFSGISFNNVLNQIYKAIKNESFNLEDLEKQSFIIYVLNSLEIELDSNFSIYHKKAIKNYGRILKILIDRGISLNTFKFITDKYNIEKELIHRIARYLASVITSEENKLDSRQKRKRRVEVDVELLKNIIFELKEDLGISINKINKMSGTHLSNAIGDSTIDYEAFSNLEMFLGRKIPHNVIAGVKRSKKWDFLYINEEGEYLSYDDAIDAAANYLINDILKGDLLNYSKTYISETLKRGDYINAIEKRRLSFNDILESADLDLNYEQRWKALYMDDKGELFEEDIIIKNFGIYLKELIKKHNWDLEQDEGPTYEFLQIHGNGFTQAFASLGIKYNDILESAGLKVRHEIKWSFLDRDLRGKKLSKSEQIRRAAKYLKEIIITKRFLEKHELDQDMPPPYSILEKTHSSFMVAITQRKIPFNDILRQAGYQPYEPSIIKELGRDFHSILEALFIKHCLSKGLLGFYEPYPSKKTLNQKLKKKYGNNHCDSGIILLNIEDLKFLTNFKKISSRARVIPDKIEMINIDYFFGNSAKRIAIKCLKAYQAKNKMLILMPLHATKYNKLNPPYFIPNRNNVKIMHPFEFAEFMGYNGTIYNEFIETIKLAKRSIIDKNMRSSLRDKAKKAKKFLTQNPQYSHKGLEKFLNKKNILRMDLLEYCP